MSSRPLTPTCPAPPRRTTAMRPSWRRSATGKNPCPDTTRDRSRPGGLGSAASGPELAAAAANNIKVTTKNRARMSMAHQLGLGADPQPALGILRPPQAETTEPRTMLTRRSSQPEHGLSSSLGSLLPGVLPTAPVRPNRLRAGPGRGALTRDDGVGIPDRPRPPERVHVRFLGQQKLEERLPLETAGLRDGQQEQVLRRDPLEERSRDLPLHRQLPDRALGHVVLPRDAV